MNPHSLISRRQALKSIAAASAAGSVWPSWSQGFPSGPLKIIIPLGAGGAADAIVRPIALELEKSVKQATVIDHKPGGLFQIGLQTVLSAPADGHTLFYIYNSVASVQAVHKRFDLNKQLIPITQIMELPMALVVPGTSSFKTLADLIDFGRKNPGKLTFGSLGEGSTEHLKAAQLQKATGFTAVHVPYKTGPEAMKAVMGGDIDFCFNASTFALMYAPKGQVRVLTVMDRERMKGLPDVPAITETGVKVTPLNYWGGFAVRAGTPAPIVDKLYAELASAIRTASVRERLAPLGAVPFASASPKDFQRLVADDVAWMAEAAKDLNLSEK